MKENRGPRTPLVLAAVATVVFTASCADQRIIPAPAPTPTAQPTPAPSPPPRRGIDWRDTPITPGDWRWSREGGQSVARFANGALVLRCELSSRTVVLQRQGAAQGRAMITVLTTNGTRQLPATPQAAPTPALSVSFAARDPLLDAIAFSRGRFAIETPGLPTLYVPSWPEISRVVEDCR